MDASTPATSLTSRLPGVVARRPVAMLRDGAAVCDIIGAAKIFKKPPCVADLKPAGRDVAKDMPEVGDIPLLRKILPDNRNLRGNRLNVAGRTFVENLTTVKWNAHLIMVRSDDRPVTAVAHPGRAHEKKCYADI